jgi:hypothetical protein
MSSLHLDWCARKAVEHACKNWHYSKSVPAGALIAPGVWEDNSFRGVIIFSRGATPNIGRPYGLLQTGVVELTRVALRNHTTPVSRMMSIALRMLKKSNPGLRLVVSYADSKEGHHGGIYQAGNWVYVGPSKSRHYVIRGTTFHPKTLHSRFGVGGQSVEWLRSHVDPDARRVNLPPKHKYLMPLDKAMCEQIEPLRKSYPKRDDDCDASEA